MRFSNSRRNVQGAEVMTEIRQGRKCGNASFIGYVSVLLGSTVLLVGSAVQSADEEAQMISRIEGDTDAPSAPVAPMVRSRIPAKVTIQPESIVQVSVKEDPGLDGSYEVNESSAIQLRSVGLVFLQNMTAEEAGNSVKKVLLDRGFRSANVELKIIKPSYDRIKVTGGVAQPGDLKIGPGTTITLAEALTRAGGLKTQAKGTRIKVVREGLRNPIGIQAKGEEYTLVDSNGEPLVPEVELQNNDLVGVFSGESGVESGLGEKKITLLGDGPRGIIRFTDNEACTMLNLVFKAGTLNRWIDTKRVEVHREGADGAVQVIKVNVERLLKTGDKKDDLPLENGDRVIFKERRILF